MKCKLTSNGALAKDAALPAVLAKRGKSSITIAGTRVRRNGSLIALVALVTQKITALLVDAAFPFSCQEIAIEALFLLSISLKSLSLSLLVLSLLVGILSLLRLILSLSAAILSLLVKILSLFAGILSLFATILSLSAAFYSIYLAVIAVNFTVSMSDGFAMVITLKPLSIPNFPPG